MSFNALIVEDEPMNADGLRLMLERSHKDISVMGVAETVGSAVNMIDSLKPDLAFIDIKLPDGDGFEIFKHASYKKFSTIFTTAYDQFALKAFNFSAIDYILKPIKDNELSRAVMRFKQQPAVSFGCDNLVQGIDKLPLPTMNGVWFINLEDILYCQADNNYTTVYLKNEKTYVACRTLQTVEELLQGKSFLRIHRSFIVNLKYLQKFTRGKQAFISIENGKEFPVGEQYRSAVQEILGV